MRPYGLAISVVLPIAPLGQILDLLCLLLGLRDMVIRVGIGHRPLSPSKVIPRVDPIIRKPAVQLIALRGLTNLQMMASSSSGLATTIFRLCF